MAVPFTLPLQSQVTDENALTTLTDVKNEINNNNITTSNNTFTGSNTFQGPVTFENPNYAASQASYAHIDVKVPYIELWNLKTAWNVTPSKRTEAAYSVKDKNGMTMGSFSLARETNGDTTISFHLHAANGVWSQPGQVLSQIIKANGTLESRASEPPANAKDNRIATCKFVIDKINTIPSTLTGTTAPTTSTTGSIGQLYVDTNSGNGYICVNISNGVYNWKQITYSPV